MPDENTVFERDDMIEIYGGIVDTQIVKKSMMRNFVDMHKIMGTDTKTVRRMGGGTIQGINDTNAGDRIDATNRNFDRAQVVVDTIILSRDKVTKLNGLQSDVDMLREMGRDHGKELGEFFDAALLSMGVKTSLSQVTAGVADGSIKGNQGRDLGDAFKSGYAQDLLAVGDEADPDAFYTACAGIVVDMQENRVDTDEMALFLRPREYEVLINNDKLINRDYSRENGDFADGTLKTVNGVAVMKTPLLADSTIDLTPLSDGAEYVPTAAELRCKALFMHPNSLLGGETISLTSNIHWEELELSDFVTSYLAFGAAPRRPDLTGALFALA